MSSRGDSRSEDYVSIFFFLPIFNLLNVTFMFNSLSAVKVERKRGKSRIFYLFVVLITDALRILFYYNSVFTSRL